MSDRLGILKRYVQRRDEANKKSFKEVLEEFENHRYSVKELIVLNKFMITHNIPSYNFSSIQHTQTVSFRFDDNNNFFVMKLNKPYVMSLSLYIDDNGQYNFMEGSGFKRIVSKEIELDFLKAFNRYYPQVRDDFYKHIDSFEQKMFN